MSLIFKPEMFMLVTRESTDSERSAKEANEIFKKWLEKQPVVYKNMESLQGWAPRTLGISVSDTHTARLVCIEPIRQPCVKHEPQCRVKPHGLAPYYELIEHQKCKHCGVELVANWHPK